MPEPGLTCQKCGCTELITQLRKVTVDIGWKMTQMHAIAPARMCTKCGNLTVTINAAVGDLAGLVPEPDAGPTLVPEPDAGPTLVTKDKQVTSTKAKGAKPAQSWLSGWLAKLV